MKSYKEMAAEAIRRRDKYIKLRQKRIKKAAIVVTVLLLFVGIGGSAWMIGANKADTPNKPPKITQGHISDSDTKDENTTTSETEGRAPLTESDSNTIESDPQTDESEPKVTESEPYITESDAEVTESEPYISETEPKVTESEPNVTDKEPQGNNPNRLTLNSIGELIFVPKNEATEKDDPPETTGDPDGFDWGEYEDDPTVNEAPCDPPEDNDPASDEDTRNEYYKLNLTPELYSVEGDDCFFVQKNKLPDSMPIYAPLETDFDLQANFRYFASKLGGICDENVIADLDLESGSCNYLLKTEYDTRMYACRRGIYVANKKTYKYNMALSVLNADPAKGKKFTFDEIYDYVISLPHFKVALDYAGIDEYSVLKTITYYTENQYGYEFCFIPKTDDPFEAMLYRESKCVRIAGNIGYTADYCNIYYEIEKHPYEISGYQGYRSYEEAFDSLAGELEKYGLREYFEENVACFLYVYYFKTDKIVPYYKFFLILIDDEGNDVYCTPTTHLVSDREDFFTQYYHIGEINMRK